MIRVLVCDDHVVFAESLAGLLAAVGQQVVAVTFHLEQALSVLRRDPVDILLLDVMFGQESALDRLPDVRGTAPRTRVVLLCSFVDRHVVAVGRAGGVRGVVDKRQPIAEVLRVLERVHRGEVVTGEPHGRCLAAYLTAQERQTLSGLVVGLDTSALARALGVAQATARFHVQAVLAKLGAHSRLEAVSIAVRSGMVDPTTGGWNPPAN